MGIWGSLLGDSMATKRKTNPAPTLQINNCTFNGNTQDTETRLILAKAILMLSEGLKSSPPLMVINPSKESNDAGHS